MKKRELIRIKGIDGVKEFDNLFDAIQYQKTMPEGRFWIKTPKQISSRHWHYLKK